MNSCVRSQGIKMYHPDSFVTLLIAIVESDIPIINRLTSSAFYIQETKLDASRLRWASVTLAGAALACAT